jgi:hypothetical protein
MSNNVLAGILLFACHQILPAQSLGSVSGTVVGDDGKTLAATVTANRTSAPLARGRADAGPGGGFTISNLPAGTYTLCVAVKGRGYLDPCAWSTTAPTVQLSAGQAVTGYRLTVNKGAVVHVRLNDTAGVLNATATAAASIQAQPLVPPATVTPDRPVPPHMQIGFFTTLHLFEPLAPTGKDATGTDLEGTIPFGTPVSLHISGTAVHITDQLGATVDPAGSILTITQAATDQPKILTFNVSGATKP